MSIVERPASASDYETFIRLFPELATGDPIPPRDTWETDLVQHTFFLEQDGIVVAYGYGMAMSDTGYIRNLVVAPGHRGRGIGRAAMEAFARRFREAGCTRMCLNVVPTNTAAIRLYESVGLRVKYTSSALSLKWDAVERLRNDDDAHHTRACVADPSKDGALESAFTLPRGQLGDVRTRTGWVVIQLVSNGAPEKLLGLACFNPRRPGSFPFRLVRPSLARALLDGIRPHALPEHDFTDVVVEGDAPLSQLLLAAGAQVRFELAHLEGPLG